MNFRQNPHQLRDIDNLDNGLNRHVIMRHHDIEVDQIDILLDQQIGNLVDQALPVIRLNRNRDRIADGSRSPGYG